METNDRLHGQADGPHERSRQVLVGMADVIGQKWHPVIVHRLLEHGPLRFSALSDRVGPITNKVLSHSLDDLEEKELVERTVVSEKPVAVEYSLTERGRSLEPVITAMQEWGETHLTEIRTAEDGESGEQTSA